MDNVTVARYIVWNQEGESATFAIDYVGDQFRLYVKDGMLVDGTAEYLSGDIRLVQERMCAAAREFMLS